MNDTPDDKAPFILDDIWYGRLKWMIVVILPAVGTLYFALAKIWSLPAGEQILGTLLAVQACLGAIFAISTNQYNNSDVKYDGAIVTQNIAGGKKVATIDLGDQNPHEVLQKDEVLLKVR